MSLTALALRIAAVEALKGRTFAGDLVFDGGGLVPAGDDDDNPRFSIVVETSGINGRAIVTGITLSLHAWCDVPKRDDAGNPITVGGQPEFVSVWAMTAPTPTTERLFDALAAQVLTVLEGDDWGWGAAFKGLRNGDLTVRSEARADAAQRVLFLEHEAPGAPRTWTKPEGGWAAFKTELDGSKLSEIAATFDAAYNGKPLDWRAVGFPIAEPLVDVNAVAPAKAAAKTGDKPARKGKGK